MNVEFGEMDRSPERIKQVLPYFVPAALLGTTAFVWVMGDVGGILAVFANVGLLGALLMALDQDLKEEEE
jgi:hypothetical protein